MNKKQLENFFYEHQKQHHKEIAEDGDNAVIYNSKEFHINQNQKTLYIEGLGIFPLPELDVKMETPDWLAVTTEKGTNNVVIGQGNPYVEEYLDVLPNDEGIIIAIPYSILKLYIKQ